MLNNIQNVRKEDEMRKVNNSLPAGILLNCTRSQQHNAFIYAEHADVATMASLASATSVPMLENISPWRTLLNCPRAQQQDALTRAELAEVWGLWPAPLNCRSSNERAQSLDRAQEIFCRLKVVLSTN